MTTDSPEQVVVLEAPGAKALVDNLGNAAWKMILDGTDHVRPIQRWIIVGRVVSFLFSKHFHIGYTVAQREQQKAEMAAAQEGTPC
jgi:lipid-A-disaccharide synthase-like uncharacterized protein